jgi:two-component system sensor histidine kinase BaeS
MTDGKSGRPGGSGPVALRLTLAFVAVALAAVALLGGLTAGFAAADVAHLADEQRTVLVRAIQTATGAAWDRGGTWRGADLTPAFDIAAQIGAGLRVTDDAGRTVSATSGFPPAPETARRQVPIIVHGRRVGELDVRFTGSGFASGDRGLQDALWKAIAGAAGLAALLALLIGLAVARRITEPVGRLIDVARAMGGGNRDARVGEIRAPAELRDLSAAFDTMADTLAYQEQLRRNMVADVAHELRTPVAVLQAGHEALLDGVIEPTRAQLTSLRDEVLRLARMVEDLHTLAAADAAALQLTFATANLAAVAAAAADSLADKFDAAEIDFERDLVAVPIRADPMRLHQVVVNLLTNALKFTAAGGRVLIRTWPAGDEARLEVSDTGTGIPADELPHVFDRFWRGRRAADVAGSGIGLAVAAEIAHAHHGELTIDSGPGPGTQVTLILPRAPQAR